MSILLTFAAEPPFAPMRTSRSIGFREWKTELGGILAPLRADL
jgi:hypothetical protein